MSVNEIQVGGDHYKKLEYQHWDFITDLELPYLIGCATKYPTRWRGKNGLEDLEKAMHYVAKAEQRNVKGLSAPTQEQDLLMSRFVDQLPFIEGVAIRAIVMGNYRRAKMSLQELIDTESTRLRRLTRAASAT